VAIILCIGIIFKCFSSVLREKTREGLNRVVWEVAAWSSLNDEYAVRIIWIAEKSTMRENGELLAINQGKPRFALALSFFVSRLQTVKERGSFPGAQ
jgi:hypothetical protein